MVLSMYNSIQHFLHEGIGEIEKNMKHCISDGFDLTNLETNIYDQLLILGQNLMIEFIEGMDDSFRESDSRKQQWVVERRNEPKSILTKFGWITYHRTLFTSKTTQTSSYLVDEMLEGSLQGKLTLGAARDILEETAQSSYRKGGEHASCLDSVSKQTVKNLVHDLSFEQPVPVEEPQKKRIKNLHIVADEDHVALQFRKEKGDLVKGESGYKKNTAMPKIICVYEDIMSEGKGKSKRHRLVGKRYFGGIAAGEKNADLWLEVADYIESHYDMEYLEKVYLAGDGAAWIKAGCEWIRKSQFVLDKYHLGKYIRRATAHLLDSQEEVRGELYTALFDCDKQEVEAIFERILEVTESENKADEVMDSLRYIRTHWKGITIYSEDGGAVWGCCAEGQVSHVYSARMSSRPMGWSRKGVDQMAKLRIYRANGGNILELMKYQKSQETKTRSIEKENEMVQEMRNRMSGSRYADQWKGEVPGIGQISFRWMKGIFDGGQLL